MGCGTGEAVPGSKLKKIEPLLNQKPLRIVNGSFCFIDGEVEPVSTASQSLYGKLQDLVKRFPRIYNFIINVLSPVTPSKSYRKVRNALLAKYSHQDVILNYGSGSRPSYGREDFINLDIFAFDQVDIVSDTSIPLKDDSVDFIISAAVLEHVRDSAESVKEMYRTLKPGGEILIFLPFMQPGHASPHDYTRWTEQGLRFLFKEFNVLESGIGVGPTAGFLWVVQSWLATLFCFGSTTLRDIIFMGLMCITFPIKYLDFLIVRFPGADLTASGFYIHVEKPVGE